MNGVPVFENQKLSATPHERNVGSIDIVWKLANAGNSGDNYMAFDNYWIATTKNVPEISSQPSAQSVVGENFQYRIEAANSPDRYDAWDLPPGLTCDTASGRISGKPQKNGLHRIMLTASKGDAVGSKMLLLNVKNASPVITSPLSATVKAGSSFSYKITADNNPAFFNISNYPNGLTPDFASGTLTGVSSTPGTYDINIEAGNETGSDQKTLRLTSSAPVGGEIGRAHV